LRVHLACNTVEKKLTMAGSLAYAEMRLILARILYNFDMRLADKSKEWMKNQQTFSLRDKPKLWVHLIPRKDSV
jgi:hypothetical protein